MGGTIALVEEGDCIRIDIHGRAIELLVEPKTLEARRQQMLARGAGAWQPVGRDRKVSCALESYALLTTSAARGAVRDLNQVRGTSRPR